MRVRRLVDAQIAPKRLVDVSRVDDDAVRVVAL